MPKAGIQKLMAEKEEADAEADKGDEAPVPPEIYTHPEGGGGADRASAGGRASCSGRVKGRPADDQG